MILILDANYIAHQSRYAYKGLTYDKVHTGVAFGFFRRVLGLAFKFRTNKIVFCWDSKQNIRKTLFTGYKQNPECNWDAQDLLETRATQAQMCELHEVLLPKMGFRNTFRAVGFEADDLIAQFARNVEDRGDQPAVCVTRDRDLYQLLDAPYFWLYDDQTETVKDQKWFREQYGLEPKQWIEVKAVGGCSSDKVPGVPGVAETTAVNYLKGEIPEHYKTHKAIVSQNGQYVRAKNIILVGLPFPDTPRFQMVPDEFDLEQCWRVFDAYGFRSFRKPEKQREWDDFFGGKIRPRFRRGT